MAPTKTDAEKGTKPTPEQSAALILDYLRKQNRPYSATDISTNLKNRVTKAAATKLLKDMHERKEIEGRSAGKQIVYHAIQVWTWLQAPASLVDKVCRKKQMRPAVKSCARWRRKRFACAMPRLH